MKKILITSNDAGQRLDKFLAKRFPTMPASLMYKYIRKKAIKINDKKSTAADMLCPGDTLTLFIQDEFFERKGAAASVALPDPEVIYEDTNILIADKKSGLLSHSSKENDTDTLIERIKQYLIKKGEYTPEKENSFAPALCNRIDRNTSGLVIAAKNSASLREMNEIIKNRDIEKIYLAAIHGVPAQKTGRIETYIAKDKDKNIVTVKKKKDSADDKTAITLYRLIDYNRELDLSLMEVSLVTGRTHQIRAHFAYIGHPLLGDGKYAVNKNDRKKGFSSQALCSFSLRFGQCSKYETLSYMTGREFSAGMPKFMEMFG